MLAEGTWGLRLHVQHPRQSHTNILPISSAGCEKLLCAASVLTSGSVPMGLPFGS